MTSKLCRSWSVLLLFKTHEHNNPLDFEHKSLPMVSESFKGSCNQLCSFSTAHCVLTRIELFKEEIKVTLQNVIEVVQLAWAERKKIVCQRRKYSWMNDIEFKEGYFCELELINKFFVPWTFSWRFPELRMWKYFSSEEGKGTKFSWMCHARFHWISIETFFIGEMLKISEKGNIFMTISWGHKASSGIDFTRKPEKQTRVHYFWGNDVRNCRYVGRNVHVEEMENRKEINELF